jgi:hypothetical protein
MKNEFKLLLLNKLAEEKEALAEYERICQRLHAKPDPIALARIQGRINLIQELIDTKIPTFIQQLQE